MNLRLFIAYFGAVTLVVFACLSCVDAKSIAWKYQQGYNIGKVVAFDSRIDRYYLRSDTIYQKINDSVSAVATVESTTWHFNGKYEMVIRKLGDTLRGFYSNANY